MFSPRILQALAAFALTWPAIGHAQGGGTRPVPADRLYPKVGVPTTSLLVVDLGKDDMDGQVAACGLQGIVNRTAAQKVYVLNTRCADNHGDWRGGLVEPERPQTPPVKRPGEDEPPPNRPRQKQAQMGRFWLEQTFGGLPKEELKVDAARIDPGFRALLDRCRSYVKGVIIYDPRLEDATIEAATTIAGQTDGLILSPRLAEELASEHLPVIEDLRDRFESNLDCLNWLKGKYFAGANKQVAFTWSHMDSGPRSWGPANHDYVVANRLFTYYLDIKDEGDRSHYKDIVKLYPPGTPILGWTDELQSDKLFGELGYFMVPIISVENLTVMSSFPSVSGTQPPPQAAPVKDNGVYIACLVSDGDNLLHTMIYEPYTMLYSKAYGAVPTTWIINPAIVDLAPPVYQWMQARLGNQELGGMLGDGSPEPDRYTGFNFYCDFAKHYLQQAGIYSIKQMRDADIVSWRVQPYAVNSGYAGTDSRGASAPEFHMNGETFNVGTTNQRDRFIQNALDAAKPGAPLFLSVFFGGAHRDVCSEIERFAQRMQARQDGREYHFVRTMDLAATYRAWLDGQKKP